MVRLNVDQFRSAINQNLTKVPKAIGMVCFASAGVYLARECLLLTQSCTKNGLELSSHILSQKGLESINSAVILGSSLITKCSPNLYNFAALSLGASATALLAYRYARDLFCKKATPGNIVLPTLPIPPAAAVEDEDDESETHEVTK